MERITSKRKDGFYELTPNNEIYGESNGIRLVQIVGQLEDIEENLHVNLIIGGNALINGIFTKDYGFISGNYLQLEKARINIPIYSVALPFNGPVGYGKTWALTKEELENEKL